MDLKQILLILNFVWGLPSNHFRSRFRKMVYQTDDWKINIKPVFAKEIKALVGNIFPGDPEYTKLRNFYRFYVFVQIALLVCWSII